MARRDKIPDEVRYQLDDYGEQEMLCNFCGDYWPMTSKFFFRNYGDFVSPCKACFYERYRPGDRKQIHAPLTPDEREQLYCLFLSHVGVEDAAEHFGISVHTAHDWYKKFEHGAEWRK